MDYRALLSDTNRLSYEIANELVCEVEKYLIYDQVWISFWQHDTHLTNFRLLTENDEPDRNTMFISLYDDTYEDVDALASQIADAFVWKLAELQSEEQHRSVFAVDITLPKGVTESFYVSDYEDARKLLWELGFRRNPTAKTDNNTYYFSSRIGSQPGRAVVRYYDAGPKNWVDIEALKDKLERR